MTRRFDPLWMALVLLIFTAISSITLADGDLWQPEALTFWIIEDVAEVQPAAPTDALRALAANGREVLSRSQAVNAQPIYPVLAEAWSWTVGESAFALRIFSTLAVVLGLALTYRLLVIIYDRGAALGATLLLGSTAVMITLAGEARPFGLIVVLSALANLAFVLWIKQPTPLRAGAYMLSLLLLLFTHVVGMVMIAGHAGVQFLRVIRTVERPFSLEQLSAITSSIRLVAWLVIAGVAAGIFSLLTPAAILTGTAADVYEDPGFGVLVLALSLYALAVGYVLMRLLRHSSPHPPRSEESMHSSTQRFAGKGGFVERKSPAPGGEGFRVRAVILALAAFTVLTYPLVTPPKPAWNAVTAEVMAQRSPTEPAFIDFPPQSSAAYYNRQWNLRGGIALDLGWRVHTAAEITDLVAHVIVNRPPVWVMMPGDSDTTGIVVNALDGAGYRIDYQQQVEGMVFFRLVP